VGNNNKMTKMMCGWFGCTKDLELLGVFILGWFSFLAGFRADGTVV